MKGRNLPGAVCQTQWWARNFLGWVQEDVLRGRRWVVMHVVSICGGMESIMCSKRTAFILLCWWFAGFALLWLVWQSMKGRNPPGQGWDIEEANLWWVNTGGGGGSAPPSAAKGDSNNLNEFSISNVFLYYWKCCVFYWFAVLQSSKHFRNTSLCTSRIFLFKRKLIFLLRTKTQGEAIKSGLETPRNTYSYEGNFNHLSITRYIHFKIQIYTSQSSNLIHSRYLGRCFECFRSQSEVFREVFRVFPPSIWSVSIGVSSVSALNPKYFERCFECFRS